MPSPCSLDASVAGLSRLVLLPRFAWCRGAGVTAASVLRRRLCVPSPRARSTRAPLASLSWCYHRRAWCRCAGVTATSVLRRRLCAVALFARRERRWLLYAGATTAVCDAGVQVRLQPLSLDVGCVPSPCSLDASVAGFSKLVLPPRSAVQGCEFDCSPCPSTSAVCRRLARSTRASLASLSWCYRTARSAVQGCKFYRSLCPSTSAECRRRARSTCEHRRLL